MSGYALLRGGRVLDTARVRWCREDVLLGDGKVLAREASVDRRSLPGGTRVHDLDGLLVTPGLVDTQVNGAAGADLTDDPGSMPAVAEALLRHGVTSFVPTVITSAPGTVEEVVGVASRLRHDPDRPAARPLGVHAEGPFLAPARRGAHPEQHLRLPDPQLVAGWSRHSGIVAVTLAPELPGALDLVRRLSARGVCVWLGHTEAGYDDVTAAVDAGARAATHFFNAMPSLHHREPGLVGAALGDGRLVVGMIVDGHHVHPAAVRAVRRAVGPGRVMLVSDTTAALDLPPGEAVLGDQRVLVDGGTVRLAESPATLAGSAVSLDHCVRTFAEATGCDPAEAFVAATRTPADLMDRPDLGRLDVGSVGDVAVWDDGLRLRASFLGGALLPAPPA